MKQRKALGKGLSALIETKPQDNDNKHDIKYIDTKIIVPNRYQPRKTFDENSISELALSIKEKGVLQPIIVTRSNDQYELVVGERRLRAVKSLDIDKIPCIVKDLTDEDRLEIALIENIQRQDLNPLEEAESINILLEKLKCTHEILSKKLGLSRTAITNKLRLLNLPDNVKEHLSIGKISSGHARAILGIDNKNFSSDILSYIEEKSLNVRATEDLVQNVNKYNSFPPYDEPIINTETDNIDIISEQTKEIENISNIDKKPSTDSKNINKMKIEKNEEWINTEKKLTNLLSIKVKINGFPKKGKIELYYNNEEELDGLIKLLEAK